MTFRQARLILAQPLRFGNVRQIQATRFMERVDAALESTKTCTYCHGRGYESDSSQAFLCSSCLLFLEPELREAAIEILRIYDQHPRIITSDAEIDEYISMTDSESPSRNERKPRSPKKKRTKRTQSHTATR